MSELMEEILATEFSAPFVRKMQNAMCVSFYKYGAVKEAYPSRVDAVESLKIRLAKYAETGNTEFLVDAANFAMIEFMHPKHPDAHYRATDAEESPGRIARNAAIYDTPNQFRNADLADADEKPF